MTMPSEANDSPTTTPPSWVKVADALADLRPAIDALMYLSVSEHFDSTAKSALGFIHRNMSDSLEEALDLVEGALRLQRAAPLPAGQ
jgi:hypothetical protein